jgi:hypothetical protein
MRREPQDAAVADRSGGLAAAPRLTYRNAKCDVARNVYRLEIRERKRPSSGARAAAEHVMNSPATLQPRLPRVMCPECGRIMNLVRAERHLEPEQRIETLTFACTCGFTLAQTVGRYD